VYSIGSANRYGWEIDVAARTNCFIEIFDCTVDEFYPPVSLLSRIRTHKICLGDKDEVVGGKKFLNWFSLNKLTGVKGNPDFLKMDIEGFEYRVVEALYKTFLKEGGGNLPLQIAFEQHYLTGGSSQPAWANQNPGLSAGDMAILWVDLTDMGYVLVGRQDQWACPFCTELAAMRAFC
jgi:hypothetical protein